MLGVLSFAGWKVMGIWNDAKDNREAMARAHTVIEDQKQELDNRWAIIADRDKQLEESFARETELKKQLTDATEQAQREKDAVQVEQLQRLSEKTRFGKEETDENTLLSRAMQRGTKKVFNELEDISE